MRTPAAPALAASLHVVSAAPPAGSDLPGVRAMAAAYGKKFPDAPLDSGVLSGYHAARLMGTGLAAACEAGDLTRAGVVRAHRAQSSADAGLGMPQDFSDVARPASLKTYVLRPDAEVPGGLVTAEEAREAPGVRAYVEGRTD
ncbi:hypothetical protein BJP40_15605 [Streptomyces sp. CC53]|nr:hypothetical protein BJP40_15605 [Streptomyces sp. CC53]